MLMANVAEPGVSLQATGVQITAVLAALVLLLFVIWRFLVGQEGSELEGSPRALLPEEPASGGNGELQSRAQKKAKGLQRRDHRIQQDTFAHCLLVGSLKGHSETITSMDWSSNGHQLITCSEDRTLRLWSAREFQNREHRHSRASIVLDHATFVRFTSDARVVALWLALADTLRLCKIQCQNDRTLRLVPLCADFPRQHKAEVIAIDIAATGRFLMTASSDTTIILWNMKGVVLSSINTNQMQNSYVAVSPCGRFVGSCGFTPDVKIWEVRFGKTGEFREVTRAFELKGHKAGVVSFAFSNDSTRMVSASKDGTWRIWDTELEFRGQRDPQLLLSVPLTGDPKTLQIALSPDSHVAALASGGDVSVLSTATGEVMETFASLHGGYTTSKLAFDPDGRFLACCGGRLARVFHNAPGRRAAAMHLEGAARNATSDSVRRRLLGQRDKELAALHAINGTKR
uniref:transducin beta-like protein 2 isoform X2 n=1 Tax=Myxine glutinosa TaxID=7769 RepID=UPI00358E063D